MIIAVDDRGSDPKRLAWINGRHAPGRGVVVAHVAPACGLTDLTLEILASVNRTVRPSTHVSDLQSWTEAWLSTAMPRGDLILYGVRRLGDAAQEWVAGLKRYPTLTVWLIIDPAMPRAAEGDLAVDRAVSWRAFRSAFRIGAARVKSSPSHRSPAGRGDPGIPPPFPRSLLWAHHLDRERLAELRHLERAYASVAGEIERLLLSPITRLRAVMAVARTATFIDDHYSTAVMVRLLEAHAFGHGALLQVDVGSMIRALQVAGAPTEDRRLDTPGLHHADPGTACATLLRPLTDHRSSAPRFAVSADGSSVRTDDDEVIGIPPPDRWAFRAWRALVQKRSGADPGVPVHDGGLHDFDGVNMSAAQLRYRTTDLVAAAEHVRPHVAFQLLDSDPVDEAGSDDEFRADTPLQAVRLLRALATVDGADLDGSANAVGGDGGQHSLEWLAEHRLVEYDTRGGVTVAPTIARPLARVVTPQVAAPRLSGRPHASA